MRSGERRPIVSRRARRRVRKRKTKRKKPFDARRIERSRRSRRHAPEGRIGGKGRTFRLRLRLWCCFAFAGASRVRPRSLANVAERPAVTSRSRPIRPREFGAARAFSSCRGHRDPGSSAATPTETPRASPSRRGRYRRPASPAAFLPRGELCAGQRLGTSGKKRRVSGRGVRASKGDRFSSFESFVQVPTTPRLIVLPTPASAAP